MDEALIKKIFPEVDATAISLRIVLDRFHEGIIITDTHGVVRYMNEAQAAIDDLSIQDVIGKKVKSIYYLDKTDNPTMACLKAGKAINNLACYYHTHLGRMVNSIHNIYPISAGDRIIGTICFVSDYRNIERTLTRVVKSAPPLSSPENAKSQATTISPPNKNSTRYTFDDIIGTDPDLLAAIETAKLASESMSPILIFGETGVGKELFAQSIHNHSRRRANPYVAINCAAIPENLLEGILFGTSKGAFTGAIDKAGLFETADRGTLFLDEVNSMPQSLQAKLLRFLQERKIRRVGAAKEIDVDLKIISSINALPHQAIESGSMRSDLFYRLGVVFIRIPPLRDRTGDLNRLITHFLTKTNRLLSKKVSGISTEVADYLKHYHWPGNVRELEHVIEGAMNLVGLDNTIEIRHLPPQLHLTDQLQNAALTRAWAHDRQMDQAGPVFSTSKQRSSTKTLAQTKAEHEIDTIVDALIRTGGNAAKAARSIGISPQLMNYKLKRYNINKQHYRHGNQNDF